MDMEHPATTSRESQSGALIRLRGLYPSLKTALQKVATLILKQPEMAIYASVNEVAAASGVSEATVMRFCRTLGFKGFQDFKIALAQEMVAPLPRPEDEVAEGDDPATLVRKVFLTNIAALQDTLEVLNLEAMQDAAQLLLNSRQIMVVGVGLSGPIVDYAANRFFRLGLNVHSYTDVLLMMMAASLLTPADVLLAISHSGGTRETVEAVRQAQKSGAKVVCITNNSLAPLTRLSDLVLVTASREARPQQEGPASRLCQLSIIDSLFTLMVLARPEQARENLAKIEKVISKQY